jgi:hypothetical protein
MKRLWLGVAILAAGIGLGCSQGSESSPSPPDLDTLRAALEERDELERTYLLTSFLRTLGPADVQSALEEVEKHRAGFDKEEVRLFMYAWTRFDGPGAFATARDWPTAWRSILMEGAMHAWGFNDGRAALAECEKVEEEELRERLRQALVSGWVASDDRLGASEYAAALPNSRRRVRIALRLAGHAKRDGPDAVIAWAAAVPEDAPNDFKSTAFSAAGGAIARLDPERAAAWYEANIEHSYSSAALRLIANNWSSYHDPKSLIAWLESLPNDESREVERFEASRTAFRSWATKAPEEIEAWIETASAGPMRDWAIVELARSIADASPADATLWAGRIEDEELRRTRTLQYIRQWFAADPDAAHAWLADADVPAGVRKQALASPHARLRNTAKKVEPDG